MSALDGRLDKLMPALSAKERFLLELQSYRLGEKPDLAVRKTTPDDQTREFNHYIRLFNTVNRKLGAYAIVVRLLVAKLLVTANLMVSTSDLGFQVWELAKLVPAAKRTKAEAIVKDSVHPGELPWHDDDKPGSWLEQAEAVHTNVQRDLFSRWQEVLAIESVLDEIAGDFEGEDLALPEIREWLAEAKENLDWIGRLINEETPALIADGSPLAELTEMLKTD